MIEPPAARRDFLLDWKLLALRHPQPWPTGLRALPLFEYACFVARAVDLFRVPAAAFTRTQGIPLDRIGSVAYEMLPPTRAMTPRAADATWLALRETVWPDRTDPQLTNHHCFDVTQIFAQYLAQGAAFLTVDVALLRQSRDLEQRFGMHVLTPDSAWERFRPADLHFSLDLDVTHMWSSRAGELRAFGINLGAATP